jgi:DNA-binding NarL/FixJ family response regulator
MRKKSKYPSNDLTQRESDVLFLLRKGLNYNKIAREMGISAMAARMSGRRLYNKLGVDNRVQAALYDRPIWLRKAKTEGLKLG